MIDSVIPAAGGSGHVNAVLKALSILECFSPSQPEISLTQLSRRLNIPKSTLLNMLRTLESAKYIFRVHGSQTYRLGYKIIELSYNVRSALPIVQIALPLMETLQSETGETIYLTTHVDGRVLYLECVYPSHRTVAYSVSGKTLPMHCTSAGKAMLCHFSRERLDEVISQCGLPQITRNTITDPELLYEELERTRQRGYALDREEESPGVGCVAIPILASSGAVAGALSISGSIMSVNERQIDAYVKPLARTCSLLSGYAHLFPAIQMGGEE